MPQKKFTPAQVGCGGCLGVCLLAIALIAVLVLVSPSKHRSESATSLSKANIGETATVLQSDGFWPCGATADAFGELMKWAARGDNNEVKRAMRVTGSFALDPGMTVKILDVGLGKRKIRVLTNSAGEAYLKDEQGTFPADPRIGRECWVTPEALTP